MPMKRVSGQCPKCKVAYPVAWVPDGVDTVKCATPDCGTQFFVTPVKDSTPHKDRERK